MASTTIKNGIDVLDVGFVVHHFSIDFDPSMGFERQLLRPKDQVGGYAILSEQASRCRRTLKAQHLFPVEDACQVKGFAYLFRCRIVKRAVSDGEGTDAVVKAGEVVARQIGLE
jgi:hypothetical protein